MKSIVIAIAGAIGMTIFFFLFSLVVQAGGAAWSWIQESPDEE